MFLLGLDKLMLIGNPMTNELSKMACCLSLFIISIPYPYLVLCYSGSPAYSSSINLDFYTSKLFQRREGTHHFSVYACKHSKLKLSAEISRVFSGRSR